LGWVTEKILVSRNKNEGCFPLSSRRQERSFVIQNRRDFSYLKMTIERCASIVLSTSGEIFSDADQKRFLCLEMTIEGCAYHCPLDVWENFCNHMLNRFLVPINDKGSYSYIKNTHKFIAKHNTLPTYRFDFKPDWVKKCCLKTTL
jgi:hypothetical protein